MTRTYQLISADTHVNEPPNLWTDRLPRRFRDRAPRIEHFERGDAWVLEGALDPLPFGKTCNVGLPPDQRPAWIRWGQVRAGGYDPSARISEQDADGVDAEVLYPTPRLSNQVFWYVDDREFHLSCIRAYNDWVSDFASHDPERLWGMALVPNVGVDAAIKEVERVMARPGIRGMVIGQYPHGGVNISETDDLLWATLEQSHTPLSIHVGFVTGPQGDKAKMTNERATGALRIFDAPIRITQFIESGVFDRFPGLRLVLAEVDCSWIPYMIEQLDDRFHRAAVSERPANRRVPSAYFTENILSTFITDRYGIENRKSVGVTQMMWSSDYPHTGANWPNSWKVIDDDFAEVPDDEKTAILSGNALRTYAK